LCTNPFGTFAVLAKQARKLPDQGSIRFRGLNFNALQAPPLESLAVSPDCSFL
jgi:hypothetical protein